MLRKERVFFGQGSQIWDCGDNNKIMDWSECELVDGFGCHEQDVWEVWWLAVGFRWLAIIGRYIGHQVGGWTEFGTVGRIGRGTFGIGCDTIGKRMERERTVINIFALCTIQYF